MDGQKETPISTGAHIKMIGQNIMESTHSLYDKFYANTKYHLQKYLTYISISLLILFVVFVFMHIHESKRIWQTLVLGLFGLMTFYNAWVVNCVMEKKQIKFATPTTS
jgi:uncharacterized membrane protein YagU involved in acid resistance